MNHFLPLQVVPVDSAAIKNASNVVEGLAKPIAKDNYDWQGLLDESITFLTNAGLRIVLAFVLFLLGRYAIRWLTSMLRRVMEHRKMEGVAVSLFSSLIVAILYIALGIGIALVLGVQSVSFAAVLASLGLAVGMALSGQLQNLAGGVIILLTKPFKIGDFIEAHNEMGVVRTVSLFHTIVTTVENKYIYIPNGILSSGIVINYSQADRRRVDWTINVEYDEDYDRVEALILEILNRDSRILEDPAPVVALGNLADSSVSIVVRVWVESSDYWDVYWGINRTIYIEFGKAGINFPFPQLTISKRDQ